MQPESSDGFASVGTILPKEEAALLPGGLFASGWAFFAVRVAVKSGAGVPLSCNDSVVRITGEHGSPIGGRSTFFCLRGSN
jgi:hypothetical protein